VKALDQTTRKLIADFSPMWTNREIWEFEQINENLTFDAVYAKPGSFESWKSKLAHPDSDIREMVVRTFDDFLDGNELWIANKNEGKLDEKYVAYLMSVMADVMIEEEICLEFYHLATGFNFDTDTGIPDDETEAEMYLTRLQEEFDEKMKDKLGDKYMPGNNDPDTLNAEN
jgi:hypothetical protein